MVGAHQSGPQSIGQLRAGEARRHLLGTMNAANCRGPRLNRGPHQIFLKNCRDPRLNRGRRQIFSKNERKSVICWLFSDSGKRARYEYLVDTFF